MRKERWKEEREGGGKGEDGGRKGDSLSNQQILSSLAVCMGVSQSGTKGLNCLVSWNQVHTHATEQCLVTETENTFTAL